jgi:glyoxylase-like metal-dependent hydrolase (beta-lactamase superfamily II)/rhodanese-related sulfurtransferase
VSTAAVPITSFVDEGLGHSSYLVDLGDGRALVIDPPRFADRHLAAAADHGLEIAYTADTHSHADYVSGGPALAARGAEFLASRDAHLVVPHRDLDPGDEIALTETLSLRAIPTPGHTPDHLAYLLVEEDEPIALFSGGSLMVGTVGRTDLLGPEPREDLARDLYRALRDEILTLPDDLAVYPTHGAGSFCSAPGATERTTTIGHERRTNPLLQAPDEDSFVEQLLAGFGTFPTNFLRLPEFNRRGPRLYGNLPALARLSVNEARALLQDDALVVDVRSIADFATGHIPGSLSIELRPVFSSWLGWVVEPDRPLIFLLGDEQDRAELVRQCLDVGYEMLSGEIDGGIDAWRDERLTVTGVDLVDASGVRGTLVDVRQRNEYETGHVPGAVSIELGALPTTSTPRDPITVMCGHGERAMTGASILEQHGHHDLAVLAGGPDDWSASTGKPVEMDS